jgi:BMFP domain-containing protein YqiC
MLLDRLKQAGLQIAMSPQAMKLLSNPNVQKAMMKAINMRSDIRMTMQRRVSSFAKNMDLVTREDVSRLKQTIRDLESTVSRLKSDLEKKPAPAAQAAAAAGSNGSSSASEKTKPRTRKVRKVKKVVRKKKAD